jgi:hypothetical protein
VSCILHGFCVRSLHLICPCTDLQLDTLVPFFTMAIASSGLASIGADQSTLSPLRLIFASTALTKAAAQEASACVFQIYRVRIATATAMPQ